MSAAALQRGAQRDAQRLLGVVEDFGFAAQLDRVAWLAALLTVIARPATLPAPLFVFSACAPGSGAALLVDALAIIATGFLAPRMRHSFGEADQRRQVIHVSQARMPLVLLDQVVLPLGSATMDATIGAAHWKVKFPRSPELSTLPLTTVWFAAGSNVRFRPGCGTADRAILIHLDGALPASGKAGMRERWLAESSTLRGCAKAILDARDRAAEGYGELLAQSEQLVACSGPGGTLDAWSALIRSTIMWLGLPDPWLAAASTRSGGAPARLPAKEPGGQRHLTGVNSYAD